MRIGSIVLLCCLAVTLGISQSLQERAKPLGTLFVPALTSAPFPHPLRASGHTYGGKSFPAPIHYSDSSVAIFIPNGFRPGKSIDAVVYFHGWNNSIDSACAQFSLLEQFTGSGRNAVFIFPEGPKHAPDSFGGRMEEKDGLKHLLDDVLAVLRKEKVITTQKAGRIVLAGHSGAFRVIAYCLMRGGMTAQVKDVILFDALYGHTEKYAYWLDRYDGRFVNIYTDDGGTKNESENLMADLEGWGKKYFAAPETLATTKHLQQNRFIFLHSDLEHNGVIAQRQQFRNFLMTGPLQPIKKK